jgi:hypothetical protein
MTPEKQAIFDAIYRAVETHAPSLDQGTRAAIATDAALKIIGGAGEEVHRRRPPAIALGCCPDCGSLNTARNPARCLDCGFVP